MSASPLVRGAAASAILLALGGLDTVEPPPAAVVPPAAAARGAGSLAALCGPRTLPEGASCIPLPAEGAPLPEGGAVARVALINERRSERRASDPAGSGAYEHIPRRPERPESAAAFVYPVGGDAPAFLSSDEGSALDLAWPHGALAVAPGAAPEPRSWAAGIDVVATRGERVAPLQLEGQEGEAEVVFVGDLFGITVATAHSVPESGLARRYLVFYGHLDRPGPGVVSGARLAAGDAVGFVGESGSASPAHLHLEARQMRENASLSDLDPRRLADGAVSVPCDLRNVLPRR